MRFEAANRTCAHRARQDCSRLSDRPVGSKFRSREERHPAEHPGVAIGDMARGSRNGGTACRSVSIGNGYRLTLIEIMTNNSRKIISIDTLRSQSAPRPTSTEHLQNSIFGGIFRQIPQSPRIEKFRRLLRHRASLNRCFNLGYAFYN